MDSRDDAARSRRWFLCSLSAAAGIAAEISGKGRIFPAAVSRYPDSATEFTVVRLTDPAHTSVLPAFYNRTIGRRGNFLLYCSDITGRMEAFRLDLKSGQSRQLTEGSEIDPGSLTLIGDGSFWYLDGNRLMSASLSTLKPHEIYRISESFERG